MTRVGNNTRAHLPNMLQKQAAMRLALASVVLVILASLAGATAYEVVISKAAQVEAHTVETFYANKLREWEEEWQLQAFRHKARLVFLDLATDPASLRSRLYAYYVSQGEEQQFSNIFVVDAENRPLFWYGADAKNLSGELPSVQDADWLYDQPGNRLFRVYSQPLWLGPSGMGRLVMLRALDNALLYQNTSSQTDLRLVWDGRVIAASVRSSGPYSHGLPRKRVESLLPWPGGKAPAPVLGLSHLVDAPVGAGEVAAAVAVLLCLQALCFWGVLGRWLVWVAQRVSSLGQASLLFAQNWTAEERQPLVLDPKVMETNDEISEVSLSLRTLTQTVVEQDAQRAAQAGELRQLRNLLSNIVNSMPSALITVDMEGRITQCNSLALTASGLTEVQAIGRPLESAFPRLIGVKAHLHEAMLRGEAWTGHRRLNRQNGELRFEDVTIYPLTGEGVEGAVIRIDDVTERHRLEEMMIQSEKMLSVGGLAAGMAHEINNPLGGILQSVQVIQRRISADLPASRDAALASGCSLESVRGYLERRDIPAMLAGIRQSAERAAHIVSDMLEFSRKSEAPFAPADIREIIDKAVDLSSKDYNLKQHYDFRKIRIERFYDPEVPLTSCSVSQIQQVLVNLLRNAAQAMLNNPVGKAPVITLRLRVEERMVRIEVEDNGPGLDEASLKRIFEPFYTTKAPGMGTGLGLSVSYFIITENHKGAMEVESEQGHWTRFILRLPVDDRVAA